VLVIGFEFFLKAGELLPIGLQADCEEAHAGLGIGAALKF
jgi:hypothetical protein